MMAPHLNGRGKQIPNGSTEFISMAESYLQVKQAPFDNPMLHIPVMVLPGKIRADGVSCSDKSFMEAQIIKTAPFFKEGENWIFDRDAIFPQGSPDKVKP